MIIMDEWFGALQQQAAQNNAWSAEQAQKQMEFQREMSNTAHQREVADLKAAGLNPILSAKLGGASTPSGAAATADTSIVSSMVQLMDKMLDVQGTSAAANYAASTGESYQGNGSEWLSADGLGNSGKSLINAALQWFGVPPTKAKATTEAINGIVKSDAYAAKVEYEKNKRQHNTEALSKGWNAIKTTATNAWKKVKSWFGK